MPFQKCFLYLGLQKMHLTVSFLKQGHFWEQILKTVHAQCENDWILQFLTKIPWNHWFSSVDWSDEIFLNFKQIFFSHCVATTTNKMKTVKTEVLSVFFYFSRTQNSIDFCLESFDSQSLVVVVLVIVRKEVDFEWLGALNIRIWNYFVAPRVTSAKVHT